MARGRDFLELCERIKYNFRSPSLLECALTHSSYSNEMRQRTVEIASNERLEFLGDSVLQLIISEYLYDNYKHFREGALTQMRQKLVCEKTLARIGGEIELGKYLNIGHGDEINGLRKRPKVIADAMEALIAAVYLDSHASDELYKGVIISLFKDEMANLFDRDMLDYKTMLQQIVQQVEGEKLEYVLVRESGPDHKKLFEVEARLNSNVIGHGSASSKREAEQLAAKEALVLFGEG